MADLTGTQQVVEQDKEDSLSVRLMIDGVETTVTSSTVDVYTPGNSQVVTTGAATVSGYVATFSQTWTEATYPRDDGYYIDWTLNHAGGAVSRRIYFQVVRRRFESQLSDSDITDLHPYLTLPAGVTTFKSYRQNGWSRIFREVYGRFGLYPGEIFKPSIFFDAHISFTLAEFFMSQTFDGPGSEDWEKAMFFKSEAEGILDNVLSRVSIDLDDDGTMEPDDRNVFLGGISIVR